MGSKTFKVAGSTANVINTVEIVDHQDDIQDANRTMKLIVGLLLVLVILKVVKMYNITPLLAFHEFLDFHKVTSGSGKCPSHFLGQ